MLPSEARGGKSQGWNRFAPSSTRALRPADQGELSKST
jgi:hypothetical protein